MRNQVVALGVGSNLGNPLENLRAALSQIKKSSFFEVLKVSSIYESMAQLPEEASQDWDQDFLNAVILCRTQQLYRPEELLAEVKKIEQLLGRVDSQVWAPRIIDIDILAWNSENYHSPLLNIPHARLAERPFALLPLIEVWPDFDLPRPAWALPWTGEKPFKTRRSQIFFWPQFVGILNVTPDSFSDAGKFLKPENLTAQVLKLQSQGVAIIDVGAESTRPGAKSVSEDDEWGRLDRALNEIKNLNLDIKISLDCRNAKVAAKALEKYRVDFLNDVTGFADTEMKKLLKDSAKPAFVMHSLGVPPSAEKTLDVEVDPCLQLVSWWEEKLSSLKEFGIQSEKLIFDPGIGFGKTKLQNLFILQNLEKLRRIKNKVMIGHSRKSFLSLFSDRIADERDPETALVTETLNLAFVQYLRVHDVQTQKMAISFGARL